MMRQERRRTDGVVLLHGIARASAAMRPLGRALEGAGSAVFNLDCRSRRQPLERLAEAIHPSVSRFTGMATIGSSTPPARG